MTKNFKKTIILFFKPITLIGVIMALIGVGICWFDKSASLPSSFKSENQYVSSVKKDIADIKSSTTDWPLDSAFVAVTHELTFQHKNGLITDEEKDMLMNSFADEYIPAFVSSCNKKFENNVWYEFTLNKISKRASDLRELKSTDRNPIVKGKNKESIDRVHDVVSDYYRAKDVSYASGYHGTAYAKEKIAEAKKYASMSPIKNCTDLVARLNSVPERLEFAHYQYLKGQVKKLDGYYYHHNSKQFNNLDNIVSKEIAEYNSMRRTYGVNEDHYNYLKKLNEQYFNNAFDFYQIISIKQTIKNEN